MTARLQVLLRRGTWVLLLALVLGASAGATEPDLEAGFAMVDLTPDHPVPLGGYGGRLGLPSSGVHDPIRARAWVFRRGGTSLGLVSLDMVGVTARVRRTLLRRLADLELSDLVLAATHTHTGPGALTDIPLWKVSTGRFDARYYAVVVARIEAAVRMAHARLRPARIRGLRIENPDLAPLVRNRAGGRTDPSLGVLRIDAPNGTPRGVIVHFAAHGIIAPAEAGQLSAGWPGALCDALERDLPGVHAMFLQGAMGDISPRAPHTEDDGDFARMRAYGEAVADHARQAFETCADVEPARALAVNGTRDAVGYTVAGVLLGREGESALAPRSWPLPVARFSLGDVELVTVPGEPVEAVGRQMGQGRDRWVVGCAQDHLGYFADRALYRQADRYEVELSLFGPDAADRLARAANGEPPQPGTRGRSTPGGPIALRPDPGRNPAHGLGRAHGRLLAAPIRELLEAAEARIVADSMSHGAGIPLLPASLWIGVSGRELVIPSLVRAARQLQRHIPPEYLDEMEGIAEAAGVPYDAVLFENVFLTMAEQPDPAVYFRLAAHCTNVVALGEATSMGQVLHGSTLDWGMGPVLKSRTVSLVHQPASGAPFVSVTWPGMVGTLRAMGAQGIAITEESCSAGDDTRLEGVPINLLMRQVVQHATGLDDAVRRLTEAPGTCGYKVTVSDGRALDARVVEVTATHHHVRRPIAGLIMGCDPQAAPEAFVGSRDPAIPPNDGSSARRYPALRQSLAANEGRLRLPDVQDALGSKTGGVLNRDTLLACAFEPVAGRFHVALGDDVDPRGGSLRWHSYDLLERLPDPEAATRWQRPLPVADVGEVETKVRIESLGKVRIESVRFSSPDPSGDERNDMVVADLFTPEDPKGAIVLLPHWKDAPGAPLQRFVALGFAGQGFTVLTFPLPYQQGRAPPGVRSGALSLSEDLARTRAGALQAAADTARAGRWLEEARGYAPERQALMGISLGAHVGSLALGAYPDRFAAGVLLMAASDIHETLFTKNGITDGIRRRLEAKGVTPDEAADLLLAIDPARYASPGAPERILLFAGNEDAATPRPRVEALARAWGGARIHWFDGGHYGIARHLKEVIEATSAHLEARFGAR